MKTLTHNEWQAVIKKEEVLLQEHLNGATSEEEHLKTIARLERLKKGGTTCLDCTLGRNLPH